ncbi:MAG: hypothetical protein ACKVU2_06345 [Saprospiraceae bacterium]
MVEPAPQFLSPAHPAHPLTAHPAHPLTAHPAHPLTPLTPLT